MIQIIENISNNNSITKYKIKDTISNEILYICVQRNILTNEHLKNYRIINNKLIEITNIN